jgi:hypothetical protein
MVAAPADATGPRVPVVRGSFVAGDVGDWRITEMRTICGDGLPRAAALTRVEAGRFAAAPETGSGWVLHGVRSNERYTECDEKARLTTLQPGLGRPNSLVAALIPIRKSDAWWVLPQDERRAIFEAQSRHIAIGSRFLPAVARRLYHSRDLGESFDFLTWFEFSEADAGVFEELVGLLRETEEWRYVAREVQISLRRTPVAG